MTKSKKRVPKKGSKNPLFQTLGDNKQGLKGYPPQKSQVTLNTIALQISLIP